MEVVLFGNKSKFPRSPKTIGTIGFSPKTILYVGNCNHPKLGTIILVVFDFQGVKFRSPRNEVITQMAITPMDKGEY